MQFNRKGLETEGFEGFFTIDELRGGKITEAPSCGGVYVVFHELDTVPTFLVAGTGGWFKGKDPNVDVSTLRGRWLTSTPAVYVGKSDGAEGIRGRLRQYIRFGAGKAIGHWGGRFTWQIENSNKLVVAWRCVKEGETARGVEISLLTEFEEMYGNLPFANLNH